ncbi:unnamed protein product, partial [Gulo gulo]
RLSRRVKSWTTRFGKKSALLKILLIPFESLPWISFMTGFVLVGIF